MYLQSIQWSVPNNIWFVHGNNCTYYYVYLRTTIYSRCKLNLASVVFVRIAHIIPT